MTRKGYWSIQLSSLCGINDAMHAMKAYYSIIWETTHRQSVLYGKPKVAALLRTYYCRAQVNTWARHQKFLHIGI